MTMPSQNDDVVRPSCLLQTRWDAVPRRSRDKEVLALHEELESMAEELEVAEGQLEAGSAEKQAALQVGRWARRSHPAPSPPS